MNSNDNIIILELFKALKASIDYKDKTCPMRPLYAQTLENWDENSGMIPPMSRDDGFVFYMHSIEFSGDEVNCILVHGFPQKLCGSQDSLTFRKLEQGYELISDNGPIIIY
jgi:hypothetical protein